MSLIKLIMNRWEAIIGLEVHAQIRANTKIFSRSPVRFGAYANSLVAELDAGLPGAMPQLNKRAVEACIAAGLAVKGRINGVSYFDRKHYFYQDLPTGYQITQQRVPMVQGGEVTLDGLGKTVRVNHIRIEQDSGKSMHDQHATRTLVDLNRAGIGLMEIVTEPDLRSGEEAAAYLSKLALLLQAAGSCSIDEMDASTYRCDVNVSVRRVGDPILGTRCEVKNLNKTKAVRRAIEHEIERQIHLIESGGKVLQETRAFDAASGETYPLRTKEDAQDYRYTPEIDLPPLRIDAAWIESVRSSLPELPDERRQRLTEQYGLQAAAVTQLTADRPMCRLFEEACAALDDAKAEDYARLAEMVGGELAGHLERAGASFADCTVSGKQLASIVKAVRDGRVSARTGKQLLMQMVDGSSSSADELIKDQGLSLETDESRLSGLVDSVLADFPDEVAKYRAGRTRVVGFLIAQVLKRSNGSASPEMVKDLMAKALKH